VSGGGGRRSAKDRREGGAGFSFRLILAKTCNPVTMATTRPGNPLTKIELPTEWRVLEASVSRSFLGSEGKKLRPFDGLRAAGPLMLSPFERTARAALKESKAHAPRVHLAASVHYARLMPRSSRNIKLIREACMPTFCFQVRSAQASSLLGLPRSSSFPRLEQ
jgi:hypothetical protein